MENGVIFWCVTSTLLMVSVYSVIVWYFVFKFLQKKLKTFSPGAERFSNTGIITWLDRKYLQEAYKEFPFGGVDLWCFISPFDGADSFSDRVVFIDDDDRVKVLYDKKLNYPKGEGGIGDMRVGDGFKVR